MNSIALGTKYFGDVEVSFRASDNPGVVEFSISVGNKGSMGLAVSEKLGKDLAEAILFAQTTTANLRSAGTTVIESPTARTM